MAEQVADRILGLVHGGSLRPGDQLPPERDLAVTLGVSRPSLREAMRGLQLLGVLKARQGGGAYVSSLEAAELLAPLQFLITLDPRNLDSLYDARILVDGEIGRLAAPRVGEPELARLRENLAEQRSLLRDPEAFHVADMAFHRLIFEACGNPILGRIALSLYVLGMEYRRLAWRRPGVLRHSVSDHEAILAALTERDPAAAGLAMAQHMRNVHRSTTQLLRRRRP